MKCKHEWRVDHDHFIDGCIGAVCIKCGLSACGCKVLDQHGTIPQTFWNKEDVINVMDSQRQYVSSNHEL